MRSILKDVLNLIKTVPLAINYLAFFNLIFLLIKVFVFNKIEEPIYGLYSLGVVFESVASSIIASYIFYIIVVRIKEVSDSKTIKPHVDSLCAKIVGVCEKQLKDISSHSGVELDFNTLSETDLRNAFCHIDPNGKAPICIGKNGNRLIYGTWIVYFMDSINVTQKQIDKIYTLIIYIDSALINILVILENNPHFNSIQYISAYGTNNPNCEDFSSVFFQYCGACKVLKEYLNNPTKLNLK